MANNQTAMSDKGTMLYYKESPGATTYTKLVGIKSAPATSSAPATIEVTTLDSESKQYIPDRMDTPAYEFQYNYNKTDFAKVQATCGVEAEFLLVYPDGAGETFRGTGATWIDAVSAGQAINAQLSIAVLSHEYVEDTTSLIA